MYCVLQPFGRICSWSHIKLMILLYMFFRSALFFIDLKSSTCCKLIAADKPTSILITKLTSTPVPAAVNVIDWRNTLTLFVLQLRWLPIRRLLEAQCSASTRPSCSSWKMTSAARISSAVASKWSAATSIVPHACTVHWWSAATSSIPHACFVHWYYFKDLENVQSCMVVDWLAD